MKILFIVLGVLIFIFQARLLSSEGGIGELFALQNKLDTLQSELSEQQQQNAQLKQQVQDLQTRDSAVETLARQTLGMIGKDEVFIEVIELKPTHQPAEFDNNAPSDSISAE